MLDDSLKSQLGAYLERLQHDVHLIASLDDSEASGQMRALLMEITELSPRAIARSQRSFCPSVPRRRIVLATSALLTETAEATTQSTRASSSIAIA